MNDPKVLKSFLSFSDELLTVFEQLSTDGYVCSQPALRKKLFSLCSRFMDLHHSIIDDLQEKVDGDREQFGITDESRYGNER